MKQNRIFDATKNALELTRSVMERSQKLRRPSPKVDRIGTAIGGCVGVGLLAAGVAGALAGAPLWAAGTASAGALTLLSNRYHRKKNK